MASAVAASGMLLANYSSFVYYCSLQLESLHSDLLSQCCCIGELSSTAAAVFTVQGRWDLPPSFGCCFDLVAATVIVVVVVEKELATSFAF